MRSWQPTHGTPDLARRCWSRRPLFCAARRRAAPFQNGHYALPSHRANGVELSGGGVMTYSIVARDEATGALGVGVQTCMFAVGAVAPWARPGVGAVATQAFGELAYGPRCLDAMDKGASASDALTAARAADPSAFLRQVGVVSADGTVAAMTGDGCIDHAGDVVGDGFAVQANMMASPDVWPAMAEGFRVSTESFPRRLLAALDAGQAAGGDARGMMSAALLVVDGQRCDPWAGRLTDLRVDRSDDPLRDLRQLLEASEAFEGFYRAVAALMVGDAESAVTAVEQGLAALPDDENMRFARARALLDRDDVQAARAELRALIASRPSWEVIVRSYATKDRMTLPQATSIDALLD
jgi:uncharacterized Ntn-hydrolase superfamily protein